MDQNSLIPGANNDGADTSNTGDQPSAADLVEEAEWAAALEDYSPDLSKKTTTETTTEETTNEQTDTTTTTTTTVPPEDETTTTTTTLDPSETPEQKVQREQREAEAATKLGDGDEDEAPDQSFRTSRQTAREAARQVEEVATDVRTKMYADAPKVLQDKDGDPITSIQDVMGLVDPNTGEGFTEERAAIWLLAAQQKFNLNLEAQDKEINQIAETLVDLKDQADTINYEYGELLKSMPELRDQVWAEYQKTLIKDPGTDIITNAPVSMKNFYEMTLQPYVKLAESLEAQAESKLATEKAETDAQKLRNRDDRSDIFGRNDTKELDDDDKEWEAAHQSYFGK